jgi:uncharacterized membrane protein
MRGAGMADGARVTEAERERAIRVLRESYARGGLSNAEFEEKLNALFAVQTSAELHELVRAPPGGWAEAPSSAITASPTDLDAVERHLSSGEHLEWVGRPDPTKHFTPADVFLIPFSILWGGFSIFWEASAIGGGGGPFFALWGIPFVAIGLYFIFGRFIYKANRKRRTIYAVTSRRVMAIVRGRRGESVEATYLRSIPNISTSAVSDGRGSVGFGLSSPMAGRYANSGMEFLARGQMSSAGVSFYDIEDPRGVADLVERLRDADRAG